MSGPAATGREARTLWVFAIPKVRGRFHPIGVGPSDPRELGMRWA